MALPTYVDDHRNKKKKIEYTITIIQVYNEKYYQKPKHIGIQTDDSFGETDTKALKLWI